MSPKPAPAQINIISKETTEPQINYLSRSANRYPNQVQWTAPGGKHTVHFPAGVFRGGAVKLEIRGPAPQPDPALELLPPEPGQKDQDYPDYVDVQVAGSVQTMNRTNPPIIIVSA